MIGEVRADTGTRDEYVERAVGTAQRLFDPGHHRRAALVGGQVGDDGGVPDVDADHATSVALQPRSDGRAETRGRTGDHCGAHPREPN